MVQAWAEPMAQRFSVIHRVMLSCDRLFTAWPHPLSLLMGWSNNSAKYCRPTVTLETILPAVAPSSMSSNQSQSASFPWTFCSTHRTVGTCMCLLARACPQLGTDLSAAIRWVIETAAGNTVAMLKHTQHHIGPRCLKARIYHSFTIQAQIYFKKMLDLISKQWLVTTCNNYLLTCQNIFLFLSSGFSKFSPQSSHSAPSEWVAGPGWSVGHFRGKNQCWGKVICESNENIVVTHLCSHNIFILFNFWSSLWLQYFIRPWNWVF